jgi:hypothetical protein
MDGSSSSDVTLTSFSDIINTTNSPNKVNFVLDLTTLLLVNVNTPSYNLTTEQINWINQFISASPESFIKITNDIKQITSTGKIGLENIPQIVHLCADIYNNDSVKVGITNPANIIVFIKFTIDTILESKYLILPDVEKELIKQLVDTSLNLLILNLNPIEAEIKSMSSCFRFCFIK